MKPLKPIFFLLFLLISLLVLWNFSRDVRTVNILGLYASGVILGVAIARFILWFKTKREL
jgi:hypothetical protein